MPDSAHHTTVVRTSVSRVVALAVVVAVLCGALAVVPPRAYASKRGADRIAGVKLSSGRFPLSAAPDISARSGALVAADGRVLWTRRYESQRAMASTTKLMTAVVVLENCDLDETVKVTRAAARTPYRTGLKSGERRSVRKLLELLLVCSSNDAANALAIHVGGSRKGFARMMNRKAVQLGMGDTRFRNAHGLDAKGHFSSAADMSKLMRHAVGKREIRRIIKKRSVLFPRYKGRPARRIRSTDKLLGRLSGLRGGKTGFTNDARYCFVGNASRDGVALTSVVLGSPSSSSRFLSSRRLLLWGFKHYRTKVLCGASTAVGSVATASGSGVTVPVRCARAVSGRVLDLLGTPSRYVSLQTTVAVPVFAGQKLGTVRYLQGSEVIASVDAVAAVARASAQEVVGTVPVTGSVETSVVAKAAASSAAVAAYDVSRPVERVVSLPSSVTAPVAAGQVLGQITYRQDGRILVTVPAVAACGVSASSGGQGETRTGTETGAARRDGR